MQKKLELPMGQDWLIEHMIELGYKPDLEGICFGLSHMWMQAFLAGEMDNFTARLHKLNSIPIEQFARWLITEDQQAVNDVRAFFDGVELYFHGYLNHSYLFETEKPRTQEQGVMPVAHYIQSTKLSDSGGLVRLGNFSGIYTRKELTHYFGTFPKDLKPVVLTIGVSIHSIAVGYYENRWFMFDPNQPLMSFDKAEDLTRELLSALSFDDVQAEVITFITNIYATKENQAALSSRINEWKETEVWKSIHALSEAKVKLTDSYGNNWLSTAVREGNIELINALITAKSELESMSIYQNLTPLYLATQQGSTDIVNALIKAGANVQAMTQKKVTPLFLAVKKGYVEIVHALIKAKAEVNHADSMGLTPLFVAVQHRRLEIIEVLIKAGAALDQINYRGETALTLAAQEGDLELVNLLIKAKASVDIGIPLYYAAQRGYIEIVKTLIASNAKLDIQVTSLGFTPIYVAAQSNYIEIVILLMKSLGIKEEIANQILDMVIRLALHGESPKKMNQLLEKAKLQSEQASLLSSTSFFQPSDTSTLSQEDALMGSGPQKGGSGASKSGH